MPPTRWSRSPAAHSAAATLFGLGFLGAALLAAAIVPLSTAYSISEALGRKADLDDSFAEARSFYVSFGAVVVVAAVIVLIPGAPLIEILFLTQALNAVLLLVLLPFMRSLGRDRELMGEHALGRGGRLATGVALAAIVTSVRLPSSRFPDSDAEQQAERHHQEDAGG
jgi:Mn2+/Fe2+ NRAMP family transporter